MPVFLKNRLYLLLFGGVFLCAHANAWAETALLSSDSEILEDEPISKVIRNIQYGGRTLAVSPVLRERLVDNNNDAPLFVIAETMEGEVDQEVRLIGAAELRQFGSIVKADRIRYHQVTHQIEADGHVKVLQDGNWILGPTLRLNQATREGYMLDPRFDLAINNGHARGDQLFFMGPNLYRLSNAVYSGCGCVEPAWEVRADNLELNYNTGRGVGQNGVLYFQNVPILASPYLSFPLTADRMSGFLPPTFSVTSKGGADMTVPYYFNIAPNRDLTLYPRMIQRRGALLGGEFRYLEPGYSGTLYTEYLSHDRRASLDDRYYVKSINSVRLASNLRFSWNVSTVSDDAYFRDMGNTEPGQSVVTTLERNVQLDWTNPHWVSSLRVNDYKVLQDPAAPITAPYRREPQIRSTGSYFDVAGFDFRMINEYTKFEHEKYQGGARFYTYPSVSYPIVFSGGYITPKVGVHSTYYRMGDRFSTNGQGMSVKESGLSATRNVPIFSLDSGLVFERESSFFGNAATQTLEPRMYYLRVPYRNQEDIPVFDTVRTDFSFAQIFSENLFAGWDRVADADQVTTALTSRWIDEKTGLERARIGAAQRTYFSEQKVTLPRQKGRTENRSDYLFSVYGSLLHGLSAETTVQYNPYAKTADKAVTSAIWSPIKNATTSVSYRYEREGVRFNDEQRLVEGAFQWPFTYSVFGVGRIQYSLAEKRSVQSVFGMEYKNNCCWSLRMVAQRYAVAKDDVTTSYFLQLELNGLARIGSNPIDVLRSSIPGYELINDPIQNRSTYERYE